MVQVTTVLLHYYYTWYDPLNLADDVHFLAIHQPGDMTTMKILYLVIGSLASVVILDGIASSLRPCQAIVYAYQLMCPYAIFSLEDLLDYAR
jgi:hypothetical protein